LKIKVDELHKKKYFDRVVKELANLIQAKYEEVYHTSPPYNFVDLKRMAQKFRRINRIRYIDNTLFRAKLIPVDKGFEVYLNSSQTQNSQIFSLAHEIGHTFFYDLKTDIPQPLLKNPIYDPVIERFCDRFAAELIIPTDKFLFDVKNITLSHSVIEKLAQKYHVSPSAVFYKISDLPKIYNKSKTFAILFYNPVQKINFQAILPNELSISKEELYTFLDFVKKNLDLIKSQKTMEYIHDDIKLSKKIRNSTVSSKVRVEGCYKSYGSNHIYYVIAIYTILPVRNFKIT